MTQGTLVAPAPPRQHAIRPSSPRSMRHGTHGPVRRGVKFLRWPHEEQKRSEVLQQRNPILWIVESAYAPPDCRDPLEAWIRLPMPQQDIDARIACLVQRARDEIVPVVGPDNVLY